MRGYGFIDHAGRVVIEPRFRGQYFVRFDEGLAPVKIDGQWCYIDETGKVAVRTAGVDSAGAFTEGLAGYVDRTGKTIISPRFEQPTGSFHDGLAWIQINGKIGYSNRQGDVAIEPQFIMAGDFCGGLAAVTTDEQVKYLQRCCNNWDYIDTSDRYVWRAKGNASRPVN